VALPEMFATGFSMNVAAIAQPRGGQTEQFLAATAREHGIFLAGGVVTPGAKGRGRNEAVVYNPEGLEVARYAKLHCFSPAQEHEHYESGNEVVMFDWAGIPTALFICYDLRFPEVFRAAAARGAKLFVVIANWPTARVDHWLALLTARAIENQAYVLGVNRCGATPKLEYPGRSLILDPRGRIVADAGAGEIALEAIPDWEGLEKYRREFAILPDMRPDYVQNLHGGRS
jgi:predicted amidohydrolase